MLEGLKVSSGAKPPVPLPVNVASCVENDAPETASAPLMEPFCDGVKVMPTVQLAFAAKVTPHGTEPLPTEAKPTLAATLRLTGLVELFVMVKVCDELVTPTVSVPNVRVDGNTDTTFTPTPVRLTICGELVALSVIVSTPATVPVTDGVKVTVIVQEAPGARDFGHLLVSS